VVTDRIRQAHRTGWHEEGCISILEKLRAQAKSSKFQTPSSKEAPSSKLKNNLRAVCSGICFWGLVLENWNFSGAWGLVLGVSLSGGSKTSK
jgi:hypothetical protein